MPAVKYTFTFLLIHICVFVFAQDCKVGGHECGDHEQCCGGCCVDGKCIDTYRSCLSAYDVCHNHSCVGDESCVVYVPPECPGCEPIPLCRIL